VGADGELPETRYATLGDDRIAYQVFGEGDLDLLYVSGSGDPIDMRWEWPSYAAFLRRLGAVARVIMFDGRGMGSSDGPSGEVLPSWEGWADDARAVLDAVESERAVIFGSTDGGVVAIMFAASHPNRSRGLILANTTARGAVAPDYAIGWGPDDPMAQFIRHAWGTASVAEATMPDAARDPAFVRWFNRCNRLAMSPRAASTQIYRLQSLDVREALASVRVPTLVVHRQGFTSIPAEQGRYIAEHIPGARFALLPGNDGNLFTEPMAEGLDEIEEFLSGLHAVAAPDRALAAVVFTDIVGSTARLSALGDREWRNLLETHELVGRTLVEQHRGRVVKTTGDGILATFDGPGRAIRCTLALREALRPLGLDIRAGLHTGEVEVVGADIAGIAVHIAARVMSAAAPGELLVSPAVPMLVAGSGIEFADRGEKELRGVPGTWRLYAVEG
jgi:class 3 adenylate cyclase/alpha-beta hydrolase superfamily lysophospholipase